MLKQAIAPRSERRTLVRRVTCVRMACRLRRATGEGPWNATIRNISENGIGLIADRPYKPNMLLAVEFPNRNQTYSRPKLFKVTHAAAQSGGKWWVFGGTFASPLTAEELNSLCGRVKEPKVLQSAF